MNYTEFICWVRPEFYLVFLQRWECKSVSFHGCFISCNFSSETSRSSGHYKMTWSTRYILARVFQKLWFAAPLLFFRQRLGVDDIISVLQQNKFRWYGHVLQKEDWVKKCMEYEVEGASPRGRPKKTWREIVEKDCKACGLNRDDAMDRSRWRRQIGMIDCLLYTSDAADE